MKQIIKSPSQHYQIIIIHLQANAVINDSLKRNKQLEHLANDLQKKNDELNSDLQRNSSELQNAQAEIVRLKGVNGDLQNKIDALIRENAKLLG